MQQLSLKKEPSFDLCYLMHRLDEPNLGLRHDIKMFKHSGYFSFITNTLSYILAEETRVKIILRLWHSNRKEF